MALGLNDFEAGNIHYVGHLKGWALNSRLFWVQMALASLVAISGPKKSQSQGPPLQMALVMDIARFKIITSRAV